MTSPRPAPRQPSAPPTISPAAARRGGSPATLGPACSPGNILQPGPGRHMSATGLVTDWSVLSRGRSTCLRDDKALRLRGKHARERLTLLSYQVTGAHSARETFSDPATTSHGSEG